MATEDEIINKARRVPAVRPVVQPVANAMAAAPQVSPLAAEINRQIVRPGGVSPAASAVNAQMAAPGPVQPLQQPAYQTGAPAGQPQFQQTPQPVNPNPRAAMAAPVAPAGAPAPAVSAAPMPAQPVGMRRAGQIAAEAQSLTGSAARMGAAPVATAGPGIVPGLQKTAPGQRGGTGALLATLAIPGALESMQRTTREYEDRNSLNDAGTPLGAVYTAARRSEADTDATIGRALGIENYSGGPSIAETSARAMGVVQDLGAGILDTGLGLANMVRGVAGAEPLESFASLNGIKPVGAPAGSAAESLPAGAAMAAAPAGGTAAQRATTPTAILVNPDDPSTQPPTRGSEVIGQFNGRNITSAESDALSGRLNVGDSPLSVTASDNTGNRVATAADQMARFAQRNAGGGAQGAIIRDEGQDEISKLLQGIGPLNMRSKRQLAAELVGLRARGEESAANRAASTANQQSELAQRSAAQVLSAEVDMAQTEAASRNQRRQNTQTISGADGTVYSVDGNTLTPLKTGNGEVFRAATKSDDSQARIAAGLLESLLPPGATPEQVSQATSTARMAARQLTGQGPAAPAKPEWLKQARAANKGVSDDELSAYYDRTYGAGN